MQSPVFLEGRGPEDASCSNFPGLTDLHGLGEWQQQQWQQQWQQQQQQQWQQWQQQQQADGDAAAADDGRHTAQRGRRPITQAYASIKKHRERKRAEEDQLHADLQAKLAELAELQAEHKQLQLRLASLEAAADHQDQLLQKIEQLSLSVGPMLPPGPGASATDAAQGRLAQQACLLRRRQAEQQHLQEAPLLWQRYQAYLQACTAKLVAQANNPEQALAAAAESMAAARGGAAPVPRSQPGSAAPDSTGFPAFPFSLTESLALWKISRHAGLPSQDQQQGPPAAATAASSGTSSGSSTVSGEMTMTLNLQTGRHNPVPVSFWSKAAGQIMLRAKQRELMDVGWQLFSDAMDKLNSQRDDLRQQLREANAAASAGTGPVPGCLALQRLPSSGGLDLVGYSELADEIERSLIRGRACIMMHGWSLLTSLDNQQTARLCVFSAPYFPLMRAIVAHLLGKDDFVARG